MQQPTKTTLISTLCGTFLSIFDTISARDVAKTAVLAAIGATTSFTVSVILRLLLKRFKRDKGSQ